jgi:hypothetical protein
MQWVHKFLHRTGFLQRFKSTHQFGLVRLAIGPAAAPTLFWLVAEDRCPTLQFVISQDLPAVRRNTRSGGTPARAASMFASAIGLTIPLVAKTKITACG